jgi:HD-like signal output (HDOD) protein/CheY-like chemotaxis protein
MTTSRTLLFVDDEPRIIDGIRRMLRPLRDEWRVLTATNGPEALGILAGEEVDVVISDMRMPGMDGAELLSRVAKQHPNVVRIILSGQSDNESIMRSIGPTHQYLSKPCAPEVLRATLARACALRDLLNHGGVAAIISRLSSLPSLPGAYSEVIAELQSREPSLPRIAQTIARDMGMSAKVLQLVNFSMFRQSKPVSSPLEAAIALGIDNLRSLVLTAGVFEQAGDAPAMQELWEHGKIVGTYAKAIALAEGLDKEQAELCFTAGVLHDCGRLVLSSHYSETIDNQRVSQRLTVAERKRFGASHPQIGAYLLGLWGLPYTLVDAVAHHHRPEAFPGTGFTTLTAVHAAEALAAERFGNLADEDVELNRAYLRDIGSDGRVDAWRAAVAAESPLSEPQP